MGCDIHGKVQARYSPTGQYYDEGPIEDTRCYRVFSVLACVRNYEDVKPISEPRGLPDGMDTGEFGDHSFSWVTLSEILAYPDWRELERYSPAFVAWIDYLRVKFGCRLADDPAAVRLVFGFDS